MLNSLPLRYVYLLKVTVNRVPDAGLLYYQGIASVDIQLTRLVEELYLVQKVGWDAGGWRSAPLLGWCLFRLGQAIESGDNYGVE